MDLESFNRLILNPNVLQTNTVAVSNYPKEPGKEEASEFYFLRKETNATKWTQTNDFYTLQ